MRWRNLTMASMSRLFRKVYFAGHRAIDGPFYGPFAQFRNLRKGALMDVSKIDRLYQTLCARLLIATTEEGADPYEVLTATMRLFAWTLAELVASSEWPDSIRQREIEQFCWETAEMAKASLRGRQDTEAS